MNEEQKNIFLVDDNTTFLMIGKNMLEETYNIHTFKSGILMFLTFKNVMPDLILISEMSNMYGYEALLRLKSNENTQNIPVIFIMERYSEENELKALSTGAADVIVKPLSAPRLLKIVETHILLESKNREITHYHSNLEEMIAQKIKLLLEPKDLLINIMMELAEYRNTITSGHIDRVHRYIRIFINEMKNRGIYDEETSQMDVELVAQASQLHDIGKIAVSDEILKRKGTLNLDEFEEVQKHTLFAESIFNHIQSKIPDNDFLEYAKTCALSHHEKWNGNGYPNGIAKKEIPLLGRVMAIVDMYDALTSERTYKRAFPHDKAAEIIKSHSGTDFDPVLVELFLDIHDEFKSGMEDLEI